MARQPKAQTKKATATAKQPRKEAVLEQPAGGGSYIREPDGSLNQVERTEPAPIRTEVKQEK